jgi:membrane-associated phospholipid phosphatase
MKYYILKSIILIIFIISIIKPVYSQSIASDSSFHPYYVNYWVTGSIIAVGSVANYLAIDRSINKAAITQSELNGLNKDQINSFDRWALNQDPTKRHYLSNLSDNVLTAITLFPSIMLFDNNIRHDWIDVLLMYLETMSITNNIYEYSFLGPTFQGRMRPIVYYEVLPMDQRINGANRNSFYSGHTASATAATFFMVKVFSDYHPGLGNYKYLLYTSALIPPLILGYIRIKALYHFPSDVIVGVGVGALCGIIIPEFHHIQVKDIKLGLYSTPEATGITMKWQPDFLK